MHFAGVFATAIGGSELKIVVCGSATNAYPEQTTINYRGKNFTVCHKETQK